MRITLFSFQNTALYTDVLTKVLKKHRTQPQDSGRSLGSRNNCISPFGGHLHCIYCQRSRPLTLLPINRPVHIQHVTAGSPAVM